MKFQVNHTNYTVEQDHKDRWYWINVDKDFESHGTFDSAYEAQQDAITYVQNELVEDEDNTYGTYDEQVRAHHDYIIRH